MRGADRLIAALEREGTDCVFGLPGGASLPIHDALHDSAIRHVLVRHEAGAGHAAEGYAKASGRVGVALVTSGPGATNLATPIADAHMDSVPTVFLCAQVRSDLRGTNAFQETDVLGMTLPISKHSIAVERPDDVADAIHEAFHVARTGRPGPVVVDIPSDHARAPAREGTGTPSLPGYRTRVVPNGRQLRAAAQAIATARRPVLYAGGGVVHAEAAVELAALARLADLPVTTTLMALGAYPASDHRWLGMLGMHGTRTANWAMDEADLVIAVGARFDDRVTGDLASFAQRARVVHIDVDAAEIGKNVEAHIPVVGDARQALSLLHEHLAALAPDPERLAPWWRRIVAWRGEHPPREAEHPDGAIDAEAALDALQAATRGQAIVTTDVGQHQMWAANRLRFDLPRRWLTSGGLGTMGFGLPRGARSPGRVPGRAGRLRDGRRLAAHEHRRARDRRAGGAAGEGPPARQRGARHGAPAAGHVLGRAPDGQRAGRAGLGAGRAGLRRRGAQRLRRRRPRRGPPGHARRGGPGAAARRDRARRRLPADVPPRRPGAGHGGLS